VRLHSLLPELPPRVQYVAPLLSTLYLAIAEPTMGMRNTSSEPRRTDWLLYASCSTCSIRPFSQIVHSHVRDPSISSLKLLMTASWAAVPGTNAGLQSSVVFKMPHHGSLIEPLLPCLLSAFVLVHRFLLNASTTPFWSSETTFFTILSASTRSPTRFTYNGPRAQVCRPSMAEIFPSRPHSRTL